MGAIRSLGQQVRVWVHRERHLAPIVVENDNQADDSARVMRMVDGDLGFRI